MGKARNNNGSKNQKQILVVDDDHFLSEMIRRKLENSGYSVVLANDSYKAITLLNKIRPDAILLDIMLPSMSGLELLNVIRYQKFNDEVPIIMISGISNSNFVDQALRMGGDDYFSKPLDMEKLESRMRELMKKKKKTG